MQQPAGLAPLVRSPRTWPHIDAHPVSELRAPRKQGYAGPAQFKTFVTKPDAVPHHDRIFVQGLSAALSAPAQALQTLLNTSLDRLI
ncbi:MAG: hypothetical protein DMG85_18155 [Acidobacteria bacterium]|nr:MAG: hypothetical protein DMG85_18155 [Acidobacteriota bacterium]